MAYRLALAVALAALIPSVAFAGDGRIEINQARALAGGVTPGDTPGFPVTLTGPGSYVLTSDLIVLVGNVTVSGSGVDLGGNLCNGSTTCP